MILVIESDSALRIKTQDAFYRKFATLIEKKEGAADENCCDCL